jgi:hypothetical protein
MIFIVQNDTVRSQIGFLSNLDAYIDAAGDRPLVDEALLRVPLPPIPDDVVTEGVVVDSVDSSTPETKYQRELPGIVFVETSVRSLSECTEPYRDIYDDAYGCYVDYLTNTVQTKGIEVAFVELKAAYNDGDQKVVSLCHQLTHVIGRAATTLFPTVAESYNYGDTFCWSGYYHGIMEAIISQMGIENVPKQLNDICMDLPGKATHSFNYFNCVHGLGHGLMYVEGHDLFKALKLCDVLDGSWEQSSCYGGVYMENVIANEVDHASEYLKEDDLLYPCNAVDKKYKYQCYLMQTSYALKMLEYDFAKVFQTCMQADVEYVTTCYQSLGRDASGFSVSDPERTRDICMLGPDNIAQSNCVTGAVKDFISYHHSDAQARNFCEILPKNLINSCMATAQKYYASFNQ